MPAHDASDCHHIFPDAHQCGSPALRGEAFCYFHHPDRKPVADPYARRARRGFTLPTPDSPEALQVALYSLINLIAANKVDVRRAGILLYSLQLAGQNLPAEYPNAGPYSSYSEPEPSPSQPSSPASHPA